MINKKVMALLLSASMAFTASVPVLADDYDDYYSRFTGSYNVNFELEDGGKNYGIVYYADGTHKKEEVDVEVSENSVTDTDTVYHLPQSPNAYGTFSWNIYAPRVKNENDSKADRVEYRWVNSKTVSTNFWGNNTDVTSNGGLLYCTPTNEVNVDKEYVIATEAAGYEVTFSPCLGFLHDLSGSFDYGDIVAHDGDTYHEFIMIDNGDGTYGHKEVRSDEDANYEAWYVYDNWDSTDKSTDFKLTAPKYVDAPDLTSGYEFVKWVDATKIFKYEKDSIEGDLPDLAAGAEAQLPELQGYGRYYGNYVAVFKEANKTNDKIVEKTVSANAGNHTIALKMNEAPAYTGGKLRATDFISSFKIDGKEYPAKDIKIKVEGDKKVGSKVKVTIKKIKGADKQTNKDVKGTVLGEVTIRPIDVSEVTTWNKTFTKEGQIVVKTNKNGDIKSVAAVVSKKGVNSGDNKAKKLKVKKGTYTYDSAKKTITFNDGAICKGSVTVK